MKIGDNIAIELMTKPGLSEGTPDNNHTGWVHLAIAVGGAEKVDLLAQARRRAGYFSLAAAYHRRRLL
ncbi:Uncharacterised protein [Raoultella terrigena]|uniref:Uncharacterized protein n=1 Tax=Raoultella terrigena TaxID=577 RepID=A0A4U9CXM5_RAOTE|nr:Uncharacterised protein [Raoultella terrigena]